MLAGHSSAEYGLILAVSSLLKLARSGQVTIDHEKMRWRDAYVGCFLNPVSRPIPTLFRIE
jgi:hypothetical protein